MSFTGGAASSKSDSAGYVTSPFNAGDFVVNWGDGDATTGDRTAPASGSLAGAVGGASAPLLIAGAIILGALLWKRSR
jgi:hypothetical protein